MSIALASRQKVSVVKPTIAVSILIAGLFYPILSGLEPVFPKEYLGQFVIESANYSIAIYNLQSPTDFYKISPFDDVIIFADGSRQKVLPADTNLTNIYLRTNRSLIKKLRLIMQTSLKKAPIKFIQRSHDSLQITYTATTDPKLGKVLITKHLTNLPRKAVGFSSAFGFTKNDFVTDSSGNLYTRQQNMELARDILQREIKLIPNNKEDKVVVKNTRFIEITNPNSPEKLIIKVLPNQKVTIDRVYRLIELEETPSRPQTEVRRTQTIVVSPYSP